jgi:Spy/CpxP family protein refolding chaperone
MFDRSRLWAATLLVAVFAAGVAVGGALTWAIGHRDERHRPERPRQEISYLDRVDRELHLTAAQRDSVAAILRRYDQPMQDLWRTARQRLDSLRVKVRADIGAVLSDEQRQQYRLMNQRMDSLRAVRERGGSSRDH